MNTSDLSGNESSDGSGKNRTKQNYSNVFVGLFAESPGQIGDDNGFDEPIRMRSAECN